MSRIRLSPTKPVQSLLDAVVVDGRSAEGLTLTALAEGAETTRQAIYNARDAGDRVQLSTLARLAKAAGGKIRISFVRE